MSEDTIIESGTGIGIVLAGIDTGVAGMASLEGWGGV